MAIAKISGQGLTAIALSVALLWGCVVSEHLIVQHANLEASRVLQEIRMMRLRRSHPIPVSLPVRQVSPTRSVVG